MDENISFYSKHASSLTEQYNNVDFESVHREWVTEIPQRGIALDVGAGSGRDARFLARQGLKVIAIEPSEAMRQLAKQNPLGKLRTSPAI